MSHEPPPPSSSLRWVPLGARLTQWASAAGLDAKALAEQIGVDRTAPAHWLAGRSRPEAGKLAAIATALGLSPADARELFALAEVPIGPVLDEDPPAAA